MRYSYPCFLSTIGFSDPSVLRLRRHCRSNVDSFSAEKSTALGIPSSYTASSWPQACSARKTLHVQRTYHQAALESSGGRISSLPFQKCSTYGCEHAHILD